LHLHLADYKPVLKLALRLVQTFTKPCGVIDSQDMNLVVHRILKLMLAILKGLCNCNTSMIPECALQWAPIFRSGSSR